MAGGVFVDGIYVVTGGKTKTGGVAEGGGGVVSPPPDVVGAESSKFFMIMLFQLKVHLKKPG